MEYSMWTRPADINYLGASIPDMDSGDGAPDSDSDDEDEDEDTRLRSESGQFSPAVTLDDITAYLREHRGASTSELAQHFDVSTETIRRKCRRLESQDDARARAAHGIFWQLSESEE